MIEKMKFISISGPKEDLDRMVNQTLCRYEIHLENALTELKSAHNLGPYSGDNPYREPLLKAQKLTEGLQGNTKISGSTMSLKKAVSIIETMDRSILDFKNHQDELDVKLKDTHALLEQVRLYQELDFNISVILGLKHVKYRFGRVLKELYPQMEAFSETSADTILCKCHETERYISLLYFVPETVSKKIDAVFSSLQFERIFIPDQIEGTPQEEIDRLERELANLKSQIREIQAKRERCLSENQDRLLTAKRILETYNSNYSVRKYAACTRDEEHPFYILCGWISEEEAKHLGAELRSDKETIAVLEDSKEHVTSTPPTKLKNFSLFKPFEMFVQMYGLPAYDEFDPTLLIAITYSLFFGFMFGDAGQGLLLLIGGFLIYKMKHVNLAAIISCCGFFSTIFGLLFGSVFGFEDILPALWLRPAEAMTNLPFVGRLNTVFVAAVSLGMGMILLTMIFNIATSLKNHEAEKTWFDTNGVSGLVFYASLAVTIFLYMSGRPLPASIILGVMFVVPLLLIFFKEPLTAIAEKRSGKLPGGGMFFVEGFFELFEVLLSYFSNTLSFVRVGAFAVSHAAIMEVVLMLAGAETGNLSIPVVVLGNLFVCGMEGLIVGIQVLRLEYYELFSRFYRGGGRAFKPFYEK